MQNNKNQKIGYAVYAIFLGAIISALIVVLAGAAYKQKTAEAAVIAVGGLKTSGVTTGGTYALRNLFSSATIATATTTTATSTALNVAGAKKVTFYFGRGDTTGQANTGASVFSVWVSGDDVNYIQDNKLIDNVTNTNAQTLTRVASASLAGTTTKMYSLDLIQDTIIGVKCVVNETTDGEHTCKAVIEY